MLVLKLELPKDKRTEELNKFIENLSSLLEKELNFEGVKTVSDNSVIELSTKPDFLDLKEDENLINIELTFSTNMVIKKDIIGEEKGYQAIRSELKKIINNT